MSREDRYGLSRRNFIKTAVAIGGSSALAACVNRENQDIPKGTQNSSNLPKRQYAWNNFLENDKHGNNIAPRHRILLYLDYKKDGIPSRKDREKVENAFKTLERAYEWSDNGLLFTVSYSPKYFSRFEKNLPESVDLPKPKSLASFEDPNLDRPDTVIHLASDYGSVVLEAEQVLFGEKDNANGIEIKESLENIFKKVDRRTGFIGKELPAKNQDVGGIPESKPVPEDSPLYMGFKSGFQKNQASEESITIQQGKFSEGTTQQISLLRLHLEQWYEQDSRYHRVATMFCPAHAEEETVKGVGNNLGDSSKMEEKCIENVQEDARNYGTVGHSQKSAQARKNNSPIILRRDFDSTDDNRATLHFLSLQEKISDFIDTRKAMNGTELSAKSPVGQRSNNGILQYITVKNRGNYLIPPRNLRSLPEI